jgi:hypothetical protein
MSKIIDHALDFPVMTSAEKEESIRIITAARLSGHPLAKWAGTLADDAVTREWLDVMEENRLRAQDDPEKW